MKYAKELIAACTLAVSAAAASAADFESTFVVALPETTDFGNTFNGSIYFGKTFLDTYTFAFLSQSDFDSAVTSIATKKKLDLNITSFDLYNGASLVASGTQDMTGAVDLWTLAGLNIAGGSYSLKVGGQITGTNGGSYGGNINVSPVPEPETWGMVGIGIAAVGLMSRRRKYTRSLPGFAAA